jgi:protein TonB
MELKKSKKADLEWRKNIFFQIGLLISLLGVWLLFTFYRQGTEEELPYRANWHAWTEEQIIPTVEPYIPPVTVEPISSSVILQMVDNDVRVSDFTLDAESAEDLRLNHEQPVEDVFQDPFGDMEIFRVVEENPEYPGGDEERMRFLRNNITYPEAAFRARISGTVEIGFIVEPDGSLSHLTVLRGNSPLLNEEALRVARLMPKWKPGKQRGKPVRVQYNMPITFSLANY